MKLQGLSATWLKDNKPIGEELAARVKIVAKENVFTLSFDKAQAGDKGTYACRVTNANGEATTCSAQLEVHTRKWSIDSFSSSNLIRFTSSKSSYLFKMHHFSLFDK